MIKHIVLAAAAFALIPSVSSVALAQDEPTYAQQAPSADEQIRGRVEAFDGGYALTVRDERGYVDNVQLHQGTIINPTGLTLAAGMTVSILGYNAGGYFAANEIDTPYQYQGGVPYFSGHPYNYYGPSIGIDFFFGGGGWWHPEYFGGGYSYYGGARRYNTITITNEYNRGGGYRVGNGYASSAYNGGGQRRALDGQSHYGYSSGDRAYQGHARSIEGNRGQAVQQNANAYRHDYTQPQSQNGNVYRQPGGNSRQNYGAQQGQHGGADRGNAGAARAPQSAPARSAPAARPSGGGDHGDHHNH